MPIHQTLQLPAETELAEIFCICFVRSVKNIGEVQHQSAVRSALECKPRSWVDAQTSIAVIRTEIEDVESLISGNHESNVTGRDNNIDRHLGVLLPSTDRPWIDPGKIGLLDSEKTFVIATKRSQHLAARGLDPLQFSKRGRHNSDGPNPAALGREAGVLGKLAHGEVTNSCWTIVVETSEPFCSDLHSFVEVHHRRPTEIAERFVTREFEQPGLVEVRLRLVDGEVEARKIGLQGENDVANRVHGFGRRTKIEGLAVELRMSG